MALPLVLLAISCTDPGAAGDAGPSNDGSTAGDAAPLDAAPPDADRPSPQFVDIYDTIFLPKCGGSNCHLPGTNPDNYFGFRAELQMPDAATALARLVNMRLQCKSSPDARIRVVPANPAMSAILQVNADGLCGRRHNQVLPPSFTTADLARIEAWITTGAR